jgi:hypothetical protein
MIEWVEALVENGLDDFRLEILEIEDFRLEILERKNCITFTSVD